MAVHKLIVSDDHSAAIRVGRTQSKSHVCIGVRQWIQGEQTPELVIKLSASDVRELCADLLASAELIDQGGGNGAG
jgi:hypothetical protein